MADERDESGGCGTAIAILIGAVIVLYIVVQLAIIGLVFMLSAGALYGAATALWNYALAFAHNVKPVKVQS